jgi:hypothetical protein
VLLFIEEEEEENWIAGSETPPTNNTNYCTQDARMQERTGGRNEGNKKWYVNTV